MRQLVFMFKSAVPDLLADFSLEFQKVRELNERIGRDEPLLIHSFDTTKSCRPFFRQLCTQWLRSHESQNVTEQESPVLRMSGRTPSYKAYFQSIEQYSAVEQPDITTLVRTSTSSFDELVNRHAALGPALRAIERVVSAHAHLKEFDSRLLERELREADAWHLAHALGVLVGGARHRSSASGPERVTDGDGLDRVNQCIRQFMRRQATNPSAKRDHLKKLFSDLEAVVGERSAHIESLVAFIAAERLIVNKFNITGDVGNINTGSLVGNMNAAINLLGTDGRPEARGMEEALKSLPEAVSRSNDLSAEQKKEALGHLDEIAKAVQTEPEKRSKGGLKSILSGLGSALSTAKTLSDLWSKFGPERFDVPANRTLREDAPAYLEIVKGELTSDQDRAHHVRLWVERHSDIPMSALGDHVAALTNLVRVMVGKRAARHLVSAQLVEAVKRLS